MDIDAGLDEIRVILVLYFPLYLMFASMPSSELTSSSIAHSGMHIGKGLLIISSLLLSYQIRLKAHELRQEIRTSPIRRSPRRSCFQHLHKQAFSLARPSYGVRVLGGTGIQEVR